jgi:hypothetical protein
VRRWLGLVKNGGLLAAFSVILTACATGATAPAATGAESEDCDHRHGRHRGARLNAAVMAREAR